MRIKIETENTFVKRLEKDFSSALLQELCTTPLNKIRISDLCREANYPRSTFYKYYYDLEDLFNDYLEHLLSDHRFSDYDNISSLFRKLLLFQECNNNYLRIFYVNRHCSQFFSCMREAFRDELLKSPLLWKSPISPVLFGKEVSADYICRMIDLLFHFRPSLDDQALQRLSNRLLDSEVSSGM